jgi:hypothetical protein
MKRARGWIAGIALSLGVLSACPHAALAKTEVAVTEVKLPDDHQSKELERSVRAAVAHALKSARFGSAKHIEISIRLSELSVEEMDGIVHVTCTLSGRLKGGGAARSHVSFGDKPTKRKALVKQSLRMAAESVVTRLADMVRDLEAEEKKRNKDSHGDKGKKKLGVRGVSADIAASAAR